MNKRLLLLMVVSCSLLTAAEHYARGHRRTHSSPPLLYSRPFIIKNPLPVVLKAKQFNTEEFGEVAVQVTEAGQLPSVFDGSSYLWVVLWSCVVGLIKLG